MYEVTKRSGPRQWRSLLPLFPGYVFLCGREEDRLAALKTNRIVKVIDVADQARLVAELTAIQRLVRSRTAMDPYRAMAKGRTCRVRRGPLSGLEGHVVRRKGRLRFVVNVTILGQGAMLEIDAEMLEPAE